MKTIKKEVPVRILEVEINQGFSGTIHKYIIESAEWFPAKKATMIKEFLEPETLKEFREEKELSKTELVDWLNKNYK